MECALCVTPDAERSEKIVIERHKSRNALDAREKKSTARVRKRRKTPDSRFMEAVNYQCPALPPPITRILCYGACIRKKRVSVKRATSGPYRSALLINLLEILVSLPTVGLASARNTMPGSPLRIISRGSRAHQHISERRMKSATH